MGPIQNEIANLVTIMHGAYLRHMYFGEKSVKMDLTASMDYHVDSYKTQNTWIMRNLLMRFNMLIKYQPLRGFLSLRQQ